MSETLDNLRQEVREFLAMTGMKKVEFGQAAVRNPHFVRRLEAGENMMVDKVDLARSYMRLKRAEIAARKC